MAGASHCGYTTPHTFTAGFIPAAWTAVSLSAAGIAAALPTASRSGRQPATRA